jgi:hypothetical protein
MTSARREDAQATEDTRPSASIVHVLGLVTAFCVVVYGAVGILMAVSGHPFGYFSRDAAATLEAHPAVGMLSYTGILVLWTAAVSCLLVALHLSRTRTGSLTPLLLAGLGTAYLAVDDLFQLHESGFPELGVSQDVVLGTYAVLALAYLWRYRDYFRGHEWPLLAIAGAALAASIVVDQFGSSVVTGDRERFVEEGFKLFGYALLATYFVRLALRLLDVAPAQRTR